MNKMNLRMISWGMVISSMALIGPNNLKAEQIVYDPQPGVETVQIAPDKRTDDRQSLRDAMSVADKTHYSLKRSATAQVPVTQVPVQVIAIPPAQPEALPAVPAPAEIEPFSRAEMLRRERVRQEVRNEDVIQERLEELRLRDEKVRSQQLMGSPYSNNGSQVSPIFPQPGTPQANELQAAVPQMGLVEEVINPKNLPPSQAPVANKPADDKIVTSVAAPVEQASVAPVDKDKELDALKIYVQPRFGVSNLLVNDYYDANPRYSAGLGLGAAVGSHVALELGYTYSEIGISSNLNNPWVGYANTYSPYYSNNYESVIMKQNVADLMMKLYFFGPDYRFRPFIGGGAGYSRSYINYDQRVVERLKQWGMNDALNDYVIDSFLGLASAGFDLKLSRSIGVATQFKYYTTLSSRENSQLNNAAMYGPYSTYYGANPYTVDWDKQAIGNSLARTKFYSVMAGVNFEF